MSPCPAFYLRKQHHSGDLLRAESRARDSPRRLLRAYFHRDLSNALKKQSKTIAYPDPEIPIDADDEIYIVGNAEQLKKFEQVFELPRFAPMSASTSDDLSADFKQI